MNGTAATAVGLAEAVIAATASDADAVQIVLAPPFTALPAVAAALAGSPLRLAAQDMHWLERGAMTGAVSPPMVAEFASHVILGHSERRAHFGETDIDVNRKVHAAIRHGLAPIVCVGETRLQRDEGRTDAVIECQLRLGLGDLGADRAASLAVAYEPVWAIGSNDPCDPDEADRVIGQIRDWLAGAFGDEAGRRARLLYGGSVTSSNAVQYLARPGIDGALVGGASLDADGFAAIVRAAR